MKMPGNGQATVSIAASGLKCATQFSENIKFPTHTYTHLHTLTHTHTHSAANNTPAHTVRFLLDVEK